MRCQAWEHYLAFHNIQPLAAGFPPRWPARPPDVGRRAFQPYQSQVDAPGKPGAGPKLKLHEKGIMAMGALRWACHQMQAEVFPEQAVVKAIAR